MKRSDALPSASRSLQAEVGVTEFSAVPAYNPLQLPADPAGAGRLVESRRRFTATYFAHSNWGIALMASLVAPGNTSLPFSRLN